MSEDYTSPCTRHFEHSPHRWVKRSQVRQCPGLPLAPAEVEVPEHATNYSPHNLISSIWCHVCAEVGINPRTFEALFPPLLPEPDLEPVSPVPGVMFISEYMVDALPEHDINWGTWHLQVSYRGDGRWAVVQGSMVLTEAGAPEYEPGPSKRDDEFKERTRFPLLRALEIARAALPNHSVNGRTFAQWQADQSEPSPVQTGLPSP